MSPIEVGSYERLLECLDSDPGKAEDRYNQLRRKLTGIFRCRGVEEDEECALITLTRVGIKLVEGEEIRNLDSYSVTVAKYVALEYFKKKKSIQEKEAVSLDDRDANIDPPDTSTPNREAEMLEEYYELKRQKKLACMKRCFEGLPPHDKSFMSEYIENKKKSGAERAEAKRIRKRLRQCVADCETENHL